MVSSFKDARKMTADENANTNAQYQTFTSMVISGFWRRTLAFIIDVLILYIPSLIVGFVFFDFFADLGGWGRWFGFAITIFYFGICESSIGEGQTAGKWAMKIEVVDQCTGNYIKPLRSFVRTIICFTPFYIAGFWVPFNGKFILFFETFIAFGFGGAIIYLYIFNRQTRQSLHDIYTKTYVIMGDEDIKTYVKTIWKPHFTHLTIWLSFVLVLNIIIFFVREDYPNKDLDLICKRIESSEKISVRRAFVENGMISEDQNIVSCCRVDIFLKSKSNEFEDIAKDVASIILDNYPDINRKDVLTIILNYGFDIGTAKANEQWWDMRTPQEWKDIINNKGEMEGFSKIEFGI
jgi:uncharacterized RDD family membrane protein YckC